MRPHADPKVASISGTTVPPSDDHCGTFDHATEVLSDARMKDAAESAFYVADELPVTLDTNRESVVRVLRVASKHRPDEFELRRLVPCSGQALQSVLIVRLSDDLDLDEVPISVNKLGSIYLKFDR
jgi:hypothetical protein